MLTLILIALATWTPQMTFQVQVEPVLDGLIISTSLLNNGKYRDVVISGTTSELETTQVASNEWFVKTSETQGTFKAIICNDSCTKVSCHWQVPTSWGEKIAALLTVLLFCGLLVLLTIFIQTRVWES